MAWNLPNDKKSEDQNPDDKDPWTGHNKNDPAKKNHQGPPLLEELLSHAIRKLRNKGNRTVQFKKIPPMIWLLTGLIVVFIFWCILGLIQINDNQEALLFRFGSYQKSFGTGLHWYPWGLDQARLFDRGNKIDQIFSANIISQDNNLAKIQIKLSYHINVPKKYVLNYNDPKQIIQAIASHTLQQTAAMNKLDVILADDKNSPFNQQLKQNLNKAMAQQQLGIELDQVALVNIGVPDSIKETFKQIDALYDQQNTQRQQAADYASQRLPAAQLKADQQIAAAKTYVAQEKIKALEEVADFLAILPVYQKEPKLTRYRLYSQTLQEILSKTSHVVMDEKTNGVSIYLPTNTTAPNSAITDPTPITPSNSPSIAQNEVSLTSDTLAGMYANVKGGY